MTRKVQLIDTDEIRWPNACAKCGAKEGLRTADASIGKIQSVRPTLAGEIAVKTELFSLNYPVCEEHAKGLPLANVITRKTMGFAILRGMVYFLGPLSLVLIVMLPLRLMNSGAAPRAELPFAMVVVYALFALAFVMVIRAYRKLPLRLIKRGDDVVTVKFQNDAFAAAFVRLNRDNLVGEK